jgi:hypothetical protein
MATFTLRHFSSAESLQAVQAKYLMDLLDKHAAYFATRGVDFGSFNGHGPDYEAIAAVLMTPDEQTPSELIDDLYYVDEMATADAMDGLLDAAAAAGVKLDVGDEPTPADVAVQVRLRAPALLEQKHAEHFLLAAPPDLRVLPVAGWRRHEVPGARSQEAAGLRGRARHSTRGDEARADLQALRVPAPDGVWFLVRRGDPFKREGSIEKTGMTSVYYRPEKYDVLKYDEGLGELSINAEGNKKLVAHYRELVGVLLFGDAEALPGHRQVHARALAGRAAPNRSSAATSRASTPSR